MKDFKEVTEDEFEAFLKLYPNKLVYDVSQIAEPPVGSYNDFTDGKKWPESVVAQITLWDGSEYHGGRSRQYYIKEQTK